MPSGLVRTLIVAGFGLLLAGSTATSVPEATVGRSIKSAAPRGAGKTKFLVSVRAQEFEDKFEWQLETELVMALNLRPGISAVGARALRQQLDRDHHGDCDTRCFLEAGAAQAELTVEVARGAVADTWELVAWLKKTGAHGKGLPSVPFVLTQDASVDEGVTRVARQFAGVMGPDGVRANARFAAAKPGPPAVEFCPVGVGVSAVRSLADKTEQLIRAHLHTSASDEKVDQALVGLASVRDPSVATGEPVRSACQSLATLVAWQRTAVLAGWLPAQLSSRVTRAPVEVVLRNKQVDAKVVGLVRNSFIGALAEQGFGISSVMQAQATLDRGLPCVNCVDGVSMSVVYLLVAEISNPEDGSLQIASQLHQSGRATPHALPRLVVPGGCSAAQLKEGIDAALSSLKLE